MIKELKKFLFKANVLDLAVAVVIGAAFKAGLRKSGVITSSTSDVTIALKAAGVEKIAELSWHGVAYGSFLSAIINFLIVGTTLFFIVKAAKAASDFGKKYDEVEEETAPTQEELLTEIRDLLKEK